MAAEGAATLSHVLDAAWYTVVGRPGALRGDVSQTKRKRLTVGSPFVLQFNPEHEKNVRGRAARVTCPNSARSPLPTTEAQKFHEERKGCHCAGL